MADLLSPDFDLEPDLCGEVERFLFLVPPEDEPVEPDPDGCSKDGRLIPRSC